MRDHRQGALAGRGSPPVAPVAPVACGMFDVNGDGVKPCGDFGQKFDLSDFF